MKLSEHIEYKDSGVDWIGFVPKHWLIKRFKQIFLERNERSETGAEELPSVSEYYGVKPRADKISEGDHLSRAESLEGYKLCEPSDLVMNIMLAWKRGLGFSHYHGIVSPAYSVFSVIDGSIPGFLGYLVRSNECVGYFKTWSSGVIDSRLRLYPEVFGRLTAVLPPVLEQTQIARFLDHETAKIDTLIHEQKRLIELLKEKRQAVISHAVTKGLDPDVPMKDSGVEWLGEVPAHWRVFKLGRVTLEKCDGPFGSAIKSEHYSEHGVRVVRLQNIRSGAFDGTDAAYLDREYYQAKIGKSDVKSGDLLIAGLGDDKNHVGRACVAPDGIEPAMVKADCFRFRLDKSTANSEFVAFQLSSGAEFDAGSLSTGSTRQRIPLLTMVTRKCAIPPLTEQIEITKRIADLNSTLGSLLSEANASVALLLERRSALISAAVTGKIDVRGWQPSADENAFDEEIKQAEMEPTA
jgi:type I restriction enzyme S subunit